jgi:GT2 family glycosyltransferase
MLSWSLVVATLNRRDTLLDSLKFNLRQSRLPLQLIIVDASDDWDGTKQSVERIFVDDFKRIELIYLHSNDRSSSRQRNMGLERCSSEVVFFLDDDSYMHRDCAQRIMETYESDYSANIGGISAALASHPNTAIEAQQRKPGRVTLKAILIQSLERQWYQDRLFLPYDGQYHLRKLPADLVPISLFHGCRMTFRTPMARSVGGFEPMLIRAAMGEDIDISYKVSRTHALALLPSAKLYHEHSAVNRDKKRLNTVLVILNSVALYCLNAERRNIAKVAAFVCRRIFWEVIRDALRPKNRLANLLGAVQAAMLTPRVLAISKDRLRVDYVGVQEKLYR